MQIYLLATDLFALAALLLGLGSLAGSGRNWRLWPLFLLVINRSLALIISLTALERSQAAVLLGIFEVISTLCIVWSLIDVAAKLRPPWLTLAWAGAMIAFLLAFLPLLPGWPVPFQLHCLIIAVFSTPLILVSAGEVRPAHLATPLILALANF
jgi:hypothetical protein